MTPKACFSPALFDFLLELRENNTREWFTANKGRYEAVAREPMLQFIGALAGPMETLAPWVLVDVRPVGGSMFRINRDTRFSRDKSPYKTAVAAFFRHRGTGKGVNSPGFYLHLEAEECFMGGGLYHPDGDQLFKVRKAIAEKADDWRRITSEPAFRARCEFFGESLSRPPQGFAAGHPLIEDLKRKNQVVVIRLAQEEVCSPDFLETFLANCRVAHDLTGFLARSLDLPWDPAP